MRASRSAVLLFLLAGAVTTSARGDESLGAIRDLASEGRAGEALGQLEALLERQPDHSEGRLLQGVLLADLGRQKEAKSVFLQLTQSDPNRPEPYNNLAAMYGADGDYEQAIEVLKLALRTHPSYDTAYENLTKVYGKLASEAYDRALGRESEGRTEPIELALLAEIESESVGIPAIAAATEPPPLGSGQRVATASEVASVAEPSEADEAGADGVPVDRGRVAGGAELASLVQAWAAAWSDQRVDDYLAFYSSGFQPADGSDVAAWRSQRRDRLTRPSYIEVSVAILDAAETAPGRAAVRFIQSYESNRFSDTVTKTLELVEEDGAWRIVGERTES